MGLDMYMNARRYLSSFNEKDTELATKITDHFDELTPNKSSIGLQVKSVLVEVAYWRKANQIHNWFVREIQDGEDDCGDYYVDRHEMLHLIKTCQKVLDDHGLAEKLLPCISGFFFGGIDYDEYYFMDLENTVSMLQDALKLPSEWEFFYTSSW